MLTEIIEKTLPEINKEQSNKELGDRTKYIGSSDVSCCPRKAVLSKLSPPEHDIETLIRFERGHLAEKILSKIFERTKYKYSVQEELVHPEYPHFKAHVDFFFYSKNMKSIGICEVKTTSRIPDKPYEGWVSQLYWQMGIAKLLYPDAKIKGAIFALDLNSGKVKEFNSFEPFDLVFEQLLEKAHNIWAAINGDVTPECEPSLLCGYCDYQVTCPVYNRDELPEDIWKLALSYADKKAEEKELKNKIEKMRDDIIKYTGGEKLSATNPDLGLTVSVTAPRVSEFVNGASLKEKYPEIFEECKEVREFPASLKVSKKNKKNKK